MGMHRWLRYMALGLVGLTLAPASLASMDGGHTPGTRYTYTPSSPVRSVTDPASNTTTLTYDSRNNVVRTTDARDHTTEVVYDALSRPINGSRLGVGATPVTTSQAWDLNSRVVSQTDPLGKQTSYTHDARDLVTAIGYPDNHAASYAYDALGRVTSATDPNRTVLQYGYDAVGRVTSRANTTLGAGTRPVAETFQYDGLGRVVEASTGPDDRVAYTYDLLAATPTVTEQQTIGGLTPPAVERAFDHSGRLTQLAYPHGPALAYTYDGANRLGSIRQDGATLAEYRYVGHRVARRDLGGVVRMGLSYTPAAAAGRPTGVAHARLANGAPVETLQNWLFAWDGNYNKTQRQDVLRSETQAYAYDALNRMEPPSGAGYTLDAAGNRTQGGYTVSGYHQYAATAHGTFTYDANGGLRGLTVVGEDYYYDAQGRLVERWLTGTSLTDDFGGAALPAAYDVLAGTWTLSGGVLQETGPGGGRLLRTQVPADLAEMRFAYRSALDLADLDGDPQTVGEYPPEYYGLAFLRANQDAQTEEWTYLAVVLEPDAVSLRQWVDDAVTELASAPVTHEPGNWYPVRVTLDGGDIAVYHGLGAEALLTAETTVTAPGDAGFGVGTKADYAFKDVSFHAPSVGQTTLATSFRYDAQGRKVARTDHTGGAPTTTYYLYSGDQLLEEVDAQGNVLASYVYGLYVDEPLQMQRGGQTYRYLQDDQYNVLALVNEQGQLAERYAYGPFGEPTIYDAQGNTLTASAVGNRYLFTGREWDAELRLYDYRTRMYDPRSGRFVSRDTIGAWGDPANLGNPYTYVGNNPWSRVDPYGQLDIEALFGAVTGGLKTIATEPVYELMDIGTNLGVLGYNWFGSGPPLTPEDTSYRSRMGQAAHARRLAGAGYWSNLGATAGERAVGLAAALTGEAYFEEAVPAAYHGLWVGDISADEMDRRLSGAAGRQIAVTASLGLARAGGKATVEGAPPSLAATEVTTALPKLALPAPRVAQRLQVDISVKPTPPQALPPRGRGIGKNPAQHQALRQDIARAQAEGAIDIRINQQQVNAAGKRVGVNRPDLQYTRPDGTRVYIEYDVTTPSTFPNTPRGQIHMDRIMANDSLGVVILRSF